MKPNTYKPDSYETPSILLLDLSAEGILCASFKNELYVFDEDLYGDTTEEDNGWF